MVIVDRRPHSPLGLSSVRPARKVSSVLLNPARLSSVVKQVGHAILNVKVPGSNVTEDYLITLPNLRIDGIFYGSPYIELTNTSWIASSSGWVSTIEYKGKGYFSGKSHSFKAIVTPPGSSNPKHTAEGVWHETSKIDGADTFTDVRGPKEEVLVKDIEQQDEWETRKLWGHVSKGIRSGDFETASKEKTKIEVRPFRIHALEFQAH